MSRKFRVLHCPTTVAGNSLGLARAERSLGLASIAVSLYGGPRNEEADENFFNPDETHWKTDLTRWRFLARAAREFDIVHYNFGRTILPRYLPDSKIVGSKYPRLIYEANDVYRRFEDMFDLWLLKRVGCGIVVTFQGDDARQGDFCRANFEISPADEVEPGYYTRDSDEDKRQRIARFEKYSDKIYAVNPDLLHVLPRGAEFIPYANVDIEQWKSSHSTRIGAHGKLRVLHAPTHVGVKGTRHILDAVQRLQDQDGLDFEFILVEGLSLTEARPLYERADLLVDQLLCGWYGGLAVELMALGKPVVCYIREGDLKFIPPQMCADLPIINATPMTIYEVLKEWLTARSSELPALGVRSRAYVEKWHDPLKIAARLKADYESILARKDSCGSP